VGHSPTWQEDLCACLSFCRSCLNPDPTDEVLHRRKTGPRFAEGTFPVDANLAKRRRRVRCRSAQPSERSMGLPGFRFTTKFHYAESDKAMSHLPPELPMVHQAQSSSDFNEEVLFSPYDYRVLVASWV